MTAIAYANPQAVAPVLGSPWPADDGGAIRRAVRRAATLPLALCLAAQWIGLVGWALPETSGLPGRSWWLTQLTPVSLGAGHVVGPLVLLLCAAALHLSVRLRHGWGRGVTALVAVAGSVTVALVLLGLLLAGRAGASVLGVLVLVVWVVAAWYAAVHVVLVDLGPPPTLGRRTGLLLLVAWAVLLPGPLAVGRLLLARDLRLEADLLTANSVALRLAALLSGASVRLYLFGVVLALVAWLVFQCWPRRATRRSWRWYAALLVAFVALAQLWWTAQTSAAQRVTQLTYGTPVAELHLSCATWVYPPGAGAPVDTPTVTVAASGLGCRTVTTYVGYRQLGTTATGVSVSPVALRSPGEAASARTTSPGSTPDAPKVALAGARYGNVLVLAASDRLDRVADQLVAVPMRGGEPLWRFTCADKGEVGARFPGGWTSPSAAGVQPGDPGSVVVLSCGGRTLRLDPVTGLSA